MRRAVRRLAFLGLPALVSGMGTGAAAPSPAAAQAVVAPGTRSAPTGWIGISVEMLGSMGEDGVRDADVRITEVRPDGPAGRAGLRAGDVLLAINGRAPEDGFGEMLGSLAPGDPVTVVVRRDGTERRFRFRSGTRPTPASTGSSTYTVLVRADTLAERMYRAMDSLRLRIATGEGNAAFLEVRGGPWVAGGDSTMAVLRHRVESVDLPALLPRGAEDRPGVAGERRWMEAERRPFRFLFLGEDSTAPEPGAPPAPTASPTPTAAGEVVRLRPLAPYALGQNRAAGAEVVELKPELAEYFGVGEGVLVVDVAPGTPAALAGLQPGDVLTRIGGVGVRSVGDVRLGLAQPRDSLSLRLVRKGETLELLLRR